MSHGGKGSVTRPTQVGQEQFKSNWDTIFGKKIPSTQPVNDPEPSNLPGNNLSSSEGDDINN